MPHLSHLVRSQVKVGCADQYEPNHEVRLISIFSENVPGVCYNFPVCSILCRYVKLLGNCFPQSTQPRCGGGVLTPADPFWLRQIKCYAKATCSGILVPKVECREVFDKGSEPLVQNKPKLKCWRRLTLRLHRLRDAHSACIAGAWPNLVRPP